MTYAELSRPFDPKWINRVDKGSHVEDYVNHAVVTNRLNMVLGVDGWSFRIVEVQTFTDDKGLHVAHVLGEMTLRDVVGQTHEVVRQEIGIPKRVSQYHEEIKTAVSDAVKRCAMRYGVAIQLWHEVEEFGGERGHEGHPVKVSPPSPTSQEGHSDLPPVGDEEGGGAGEGSPIGDPSPPSSTTQAPTFDELVALAGSVAKARQAINEAVGTDYSPASVRKATDLERIAARALILGVEE